MTRRFFGCCRPLAGRQGERARKVAAPPAAGTVQAAPLAPTMPPALLVAAPPAPLTTAQACALANAHAPYVQMGSITASAGAAEGVFERESVLLSENRSPMSTQAHPCLPSKPDRLWSCLCACLLCLGQLPNKLHAERTVTKAMIINHLCKDSSALMHTSKQAILCMLGTHTKRALVQELTRHAANLGMLAAATANPLRSRHFYLGFQAEHKLAATSAQLPRLFTALWQAIMGPGQAGCLPELCMQHWSHCSLGSAWGLQTAGPPAYREQVGLQF